jgi:hypothetical protein
VHAILILLALGLPAAGSAAGRLPASGAPCAPTTEPLVVRGWSAYRADSILQAWQSFAAARALCPDHLDAIVGLGFASLRLGRVLAADTLFRLAVARDSGNADAWEGRALTAGRLGDGPGAARAARALLRLVPGAASAHAILDRETPGWDLPPRSAPVRDAELQMPARVNGEHFEVRLGDGWTPIYLRGVNLGAALPGRFPAEFPADSSVYAGWLALMAGMNANTVRVYTLLPPAFYRALAGWNRARPDRPLWIVHGVWAELPPGDDFDDAAWKREFRDEMRRVVDALHGACDIPARPGHAGGRYDADVSRWTLAYIIGREWEPYAIRNYDALRAARREFHGRFLDLAAGTPSEAWMAEQCDHLLGIEWDTYHALRPIAYTNWPTLDPLHHPTESSAAEERSWRERVGRRSYGRKLEYDNDAVQLDPSRVRPTAANPAGWFASYHAYPYYPDFMVQDPGYGLAASSEGRSNYFGYLRDLCRHHAGLPVVIAEYGVPSSRGVAHLQPQGWNHGGHDEREMAQIDERLTREIRESGAAGGIVFAWIDEWFKKNWAVIDLEIPVENTRRWHNLMDAEQNYGILGMAPGDSAKTPVLGGDPRRWLELPALATAATATGGSPWSPWSPWSPKSIHVGSDEAFVRLAIELQPAGEAALPWDSLGIAIALDTFRPDLGQSRLPGLVERSEVGFEFLADLRGTQDAELRVTPDYNPYARVADARDGDDLGLFNHRPAAPRWRKDGSFDAMLLTVNRARFARDGAYSRALTADRGRLRFGTEAGSSLADWYYDAGARLLELRLPWGLLNVTDPSSRRILFDASGTGIFQTAESDGFRVGVLTYRKGAPARVLGALPALREGGLWARADFATWIWSPWTEPSYHAYLKPAYEALRRAWSDPAGPGETGAPAVARGSGDR